MSWPRIVHAAAREHLAPLLVSEWEERYGQPRNRVRRWRDTVSEALLGPLGGGSYWRSAAGIVSLDRKGMALRYGEVTLLWQHGRMTWFHCGAGSWQRARCFGERRTSVCWPRVDQGHLDALWSAIRAMQREVYRRDRTPFSIPISRPLPNGGLIHGSLIPRPLRVPGRRVV